MQFPIEVVEKQCFKLPTLFQLHIRTKVLRVPPNRTDYTPGEALVFWLGHMLRHAEIIADTEALRLVLDEFSPALVAYGNMLADALDDDKLQSVPSARLLVLDSIYVCVDGKPGMLDLTTGHFKSTLDFMPLAMVGFNLAALYVRKQEEVKKANEESI